MILPWSTTTMVSASSSASSRYCVVSSTVVPSRDEVPDDVPHAQAAARVQARRGLVEEEQAWAADERAGEVEASAHAARVGLDGAVGRVDQVELLEQLVGARARLRSRQLVEPAEEPEVLAPGEVLVHRGVLAGQADDAPQLLRPGGPRRSRRRWRGPRPGAAAWRGCARSWSCRRRSGPSRPRTLPSCDGQVHAVEGAHLALARAVDLDEAFGFDDRHAVDTCDSLTSPRQDGKGSTTLPERPQRVSAGVGLSGRDCPLFDTGQRPSGTRSTHPVGHENLSPCVSCA